MTKGEEAKVRPGRLLHPQLLPRESPVNLLLKVPEETFFSFYQFFLSLLPHMYQQGREREREMFHAACCGEAMDAAFLRNSQRWRGGRRRGIRSSSSMRRKRRKEASECEKSNACEKEIDKETLTREPVVTMSSQSTSRHKCKTDNLFILCTLMTKLQPFYLSQIFPRVALLLVFLVDVEAAVHESLDLLANLQQRVERTKQHSRAKQSTDGLALQSYCLLMKAVS